MKLRANCFTKFPWSIVLYYVHCILLEPLSFVKVLATSLAYSTASLSPGYLERESVLKIVHNIEGIVDAFPQVNQRL